ncbi:MAG: type II secretion system protein GspL, partial [Gammaproteobacteria bacterium]|nr:type II secretion system protein GspL [Gammaproteobacteria bacterium]
AVTFIKSNADEAVAEDLLQQLADAELNVNAMDAEQNLIGKMTQSVHQGAQINLLQGEYRREEDSSAWWRPWRAAAVLLASWLLLGLSGFFTEFYSLSNEETQLDSEIEKVFRDTFPDVRNVVNPRVQMEQRLALLRGGASEQDFLQLLTIVGTALQKHKGTEVNALTYRNGQLDISLLTDNVQTLDNLKNQLAESNALSVEIQSANNRGDKVEGRLQITNRS